MNSNDREQTTVAQVFSYRNGELFCENVSLTAIARQIGTPCYVYSKKVLLQNYHYFRTAFLQIDPLICYAVKANSNLAILKLLKEEGSSFDVVSTGELYRLETIGIDPMRVVFSGVGKTLPELETVAQKPILSVNIESLEELDILNRIAQEKQTHPRISFRLNPNVDPRTHPYIATGLSQHKFGIDVKQVDKIIKALRKTPQVQVVGLGFHIGSQILDVEPFLEAFLRLKELAGEFASQGLPIEHLNLGGGLGIPYQGEEPADVERYAAFLRKHRDDYRIIFEPGRFIVGNAGILLNQVLYHKLNREKHFVVVDGAMNDLIRPSLYQAYHEVLPVEQKPGRVKVDVVGPICETGDFFARDRFLPDFKQGDYLAVMNAGAYGFVASSNYNSRPRAAEALVDGEQIRIIRRRESYQDLIRGETL